MIHGSLSWAALLVSDSENIRNFTTPSPAPLFKYDLLSATFPNK
jgi:hypothetical protein